MTPRAKKEKYVSPVDAVIVAARKAKTLRRKLYSLELIQTIAKHNHDDFIPALKMALKWAQDIEKDANYLEAKKRRAEQKRRKAGKP